MKVILRKDIPSLGAMGDIVNVAEGYARNHLIPKKLAVEANAISIKSIQQEKEKALKAFARGKESALYTASQLEKISCTIPVKTGESDKLYGSVTSQDIAKHLKDEGFSIDKKQIILDKHIKDLGVYKVPVKLGWDVTAEVKVWIVKS